jgi:hypothetical protein
MANVICDINRDIEFPGGLKIYRLERPDASEDALRRIGERFGLRATRDAGTVVLDPRSSGYSEASGWALKVIRASGGWQYRHAARWQVDDGASNLRIEDDEAIRVAFDALGRFQFPKEPEIERVRVERLHVAHADREGGRHEERVVGVRALFRRILDGLPVEGIGGKTTVYLDPAREVTGIDHLWRSIERVERPVEKLRSVDEALRDVEQRYGSGGGGRVEVTNLQLAYFELGWDEEQDILQPAYVFTLALTSDVSRFRMNATVPVAAAVNAPGPIEPVRQRRVQPPRAS